MKEGFSRTDTENRLLQNGWSLDVINDAYTQIDTQQKPTLSFMGKSYFWVNLIVLILVISGAGYYYHTKHSPEHKNNQIVKTNLGTNLGNTYGKFSLITSGSNDKIEGEFVIRSDGARLYAITGGLLANPSGIERITILPSKELFIENADMPGEMVRALPNIPEATYGDQSLAESSYEGTSLIFDPILYSQAIKLASGTNSVSIKYNPVEILKENNPGYNYSQRGTEQIDQYLGKSKQATVTSKSVTIPIQWLPINNSLDLTSSTLAPAQLTFQATSANSVKIAFPTETDFEVSRMSNFVNLFSAGLIAEVGEDNWYKDIDKSILEKTLSNITRNESPESCNSQPVQSLTKLLYPTENISIPSQASNWQCSFKWIPSNTGIGNQIEVKIIGKANLQRIYDCNGVNGCSMQ